jgi:hypothetical protein
MGKQGENQRPLRYNFGVIYDGLFELSTDGGSDVDARHQVNSLALKIKLFISTRSIVLGHNILSRGT